MKKINLAISGCLGRMGQQLIKSSKNNKNFKLAALTENKAINKKIAGIKLDVNTEVPISLNKEQKELLEKFRKIETKSLIQVSNNSFKKQKVFGKTKD